MDLQTKAVSVIAVNFVGHVTPQNQKKLVTVRRSACKPSACIWTALDFARKWRAPIRNWPLVLNQLAIRFEDRWPE